MPPSTRRFARSRLAVALLLFLLISPLAPRAAAAPGRQGDGPEATPAHQAYLPLVRRSPPQPGAVTPWGMNLYLTKVERRGTGDNLPLLADLSRQAGVKWTREELVWDLIEPNDDDFRPIYDGALRLTAENGFDVIGMLLTTPKWARDASCRPQREPYWCPPADVREYAEFAAWMVERYDADGVADAPGSPRIGAWEIWNEPNDVGNWADIGADDDARKRRYGELLIAAYRAIKAADPSAKVLIGSVYIFDGGCANNNCDGINFLGAPGSGVFRQVPEARYAFDVFATHPFAHPNRPDDPNIPRIVTIEGTTRATRGFLDSDVIGRPDAPIWITELGWCTAPGACFGTIPVNEEQQANYLIRSMVIAHQNGAQHVSWFQLEDAFDDPNRIGGNAAVLRNYDGGAYPLKPAYFAYKTLATLLANAAPAGTGPVHTHVYDPSQPYVNSGGVYDYRYQLGAATVDVLWVPGGAVQVAFPVAPGRAVTLIDRDGARTPATPDGGAIRLNLSERPVFVMQG